MKKIVCCFFIFFVMIFYNYSLELKNTLWGTENGEFGYYLKFMENDNFEFAYAGEGAGQNAVGTYVQDENDVILMVETRNDEYGVLPEYIKQKTITFSIVDVNNSIFSLYKLKLAGSEGVEFWSWSHGPENGAMVNCNGIDVIIIEPIITKIVITNARIRTGPGLHYTYQKFPFDNGFVITERQSVPAGIIVQILAYSAAKDSIDGNENYWYYCRFQNHSYTRIYGWLWGALLN